MAVGRIPMTFCIARMGLAMEAASTHCIEASGIGVSLFLPSVAFSPLVFCFSFESFTVRIWF